VTLPALKNFTKELFHPDHGNAERVAVIIQNHDPPSEMEVFLHQPEHDMFLNYFNGSPMDQSGNGALDKADLGRAKMGIILTDKNAVDAVSADH